MLYHQFPLKLASLIHSKRSSDSMEYQQKQAWPDIHYNIEIEVECPLIVKDGKKRRVNI